MPEFLKMPIEMAQNALLNRKVRETNTFLAGQFHYGKVKSELSQIQKIASLCGVSENTIYRSMDWLLERNWVGKDASNGWYFFRSIDRVHQMEGWQYRRAVFLFKENLKEIKPFFFSAVISSAIKTGKKGDSGTDRRTYRSEPARYPLPVSFLEKSLNISRRTAQRYLNIAKKQGLIDIEPNFHRIINLTPRDVKILKYHNAETVRAEFFGRFFESVNVSALRVNNSKVFLQRVNLISSHLLIGKRKNRGKDWAVGNRFIKGDNNENEVSLSSQ